jgi:hypothetical protein
MKTTPFLEAAGPPSKRAMTLLYSRSFH